MDKNEILGVNNKPTTRIKFDAINVDGLCHTGVTRNKGKSFFSPDFKDNEEFQPLPDRKSKIN